MAILNALAAINPLDDLLAAKFPNFIMNHYAAITAGAIGTWGAFDFARNRISLGGPGFMSQGTVLGDPHLRTKLLRGYVDQSFMPSQPGMVGSNPSYDDNSALYQGYQVNNADMDYRRAAMTAQRSSTYGNAPGSLVFGLHNRRMR